MNYNNKKTKTPFCTVCHAAGLSKAVYTSHYVRDRPGGVVVCPTLLKVACRYCHKTGHTPKHCPEIKAREQHRGDAERRAAKRAETKVAPAPKHNKTNKQEPAKKQYSNSFAALLSDSDDESPRKQVTCCSRHAVAKSKKPEFPALGGGQAVQVHVQVQAAPGSSWAAMVTKAPKPAVYAVASATNVKKSNKGFRMKSWADEMDSDIEDDECSVSSWGNEDGEEDNGMEWLN